MKLWRTQMAAWLHPNWLTLKASSTLAHLSLPLSENKCVYYEGKLDVHWLVLQKLKLKTFKDKSVIIFSQPYHSKPVFPRKTKRDVKFFKILPVVVTITLSLFFMESYYCHLVPLFSSWFSSNFLVFIIILFAFLSPLVRIQLGAVRVGPVTYYLCLLPWQWITITCLSLAPYHRVLKGLVHPKMKIK